MRIVAVAGALILCAAVPPGPGAATWAAAAGQDPEDSALEQLLEHAGNYVAEFDERFYNVVTEERYRQEARSRLTTLGTGVGQITNRGVYDSPLPNPQPPARVDLTSELVLVKPFTGGELQVYRNTHRLDGRRIHGDTGRLSTLFASSDPSAFIEAERIMRESEQYNIGEIRRTANLPTLALKVLAPSNQFRFTFTDAGREGRNVRIVEFVEFVAPTLIYSPTTEDLFSRGRLWIEEPTGRVLRTEMIVEYPQVRLSVDTRYEFDKEWNLAVPTEMREEYSSPTGVRVTGIARYGRFRDIVPPPAIAPQ